MKRVCSGCGVITDKRRCPACERAHEAQRGPRGYDRGWQKLSKRAIAEHPWCSECGHPGSPDNPLTGDHIVPRRHGGRNVRANVAVLCRACNSSKGARPSLGGRLENQGAGSK